MPAFCFFGADMQCWEYQTIELNGDMTADTDGVPLSDYGREYWEVVWVFDGPDGARFALLKRPDPKQRAPGQRIETKG